MVIRIRSTIKFCDDRLEKLAKAMYPDIKALDMGLLEDIITFLKGGGSARISNISHLMPFLEVCLKYRVDVTIFQE